MFFSVLLLVISFAHAFSPFQKLPVVPRQTLVHATDQPAITSNKRPIAPLIDWASELDIKSGGIALQADSFGGLGWFAQREIPKGSVVLSVPSSVALSVECPGGGPNDPTVLKEFLTNRDMDLPWFVQMSLYLHKLDKIDAGRYRPWLNSLPRDFNTPIHWSKGQVESLQYPYMRDAVLRQVKNWQFYHQYVAKSWGDTTRAIQWSEFLWGCECSRSRAFSGAYTGSAFNPLIYAFTLLLVTLYVGLGLGTLEQAANGAVVVVCASILKDFVVPKLFKTKMYVICPMIDMANHQSMAATGEVSFEYFGDSYSLAVDNASVPSGEQVYISYGARSNDQLLQYYGFVEKDNPHDLYVMPPLREWDIEALEEACGRRFEPGRLQKLSRAGLLGENAEPAEDDDDSAANIMGGVVISRVMGVDPAVMQALRTLVSNEAEWKAANEAIGNFSEEMSGGAENERCARLAAKKAIELELSSKDTTLDEDKAILERMQMMKRMDADVQDVLSTQFRIEKKKLLMEIMEKLS